jgi:hypothetical protein
MTRNLYLGADLTPAIARKASRSWLRPTDKSSAK